MRGAPTRRLLCVAALTLAGCERAPEPGSVPAAQPAASQAAGAATAAEPAIPPAQPRPAYLGPGIKWAPESPRYQQIRREAFRQGTDFAEKVDTSPRRVTREGRYVVEVLDRPAPKIGDFQTWRIGLTTPDGKPVSSARINVKGGMPEHGHGLPSKPKVQAGKTAGEYEINGLQFGMSGWWEVTFYISSERRDDSVSLNLIAE